MTKSNLLQGTLIAGCLLAAFLMLPTGSAHAQCDAGSGVGPDVIVCDGANTDVNGQAGNDSITNNGTITGGTGAINGEFGNDTVINNGTVTNSIYGDLLPGPGGDDRLVNTQTGSVGGAIYGDGAFTNGNDIIINEGTVDGGIFADSGGATDGNDTVINTGTVNGVIDAGRGDDQVTILFGSTVTGSIDGGTHTIGDTIIIDLSTYSTETGQNFATQIAALCTPNCSLSLGGFNYTIINFEGNIQFLLALIEQAAAGGPGGDTSHTIGEICIGPVKVFRLPNGDLEVYSGFDLLPPNGFLVAKIPWAAQIVGATFSNPDAPIQGWTATLDLINGIQRIIVRDATGNIVNDQCQW